MKKIILLIFTMILLVIPFANASILIYNETFEGVGTPNGWSVSTGNPDFDFGGFESDEGVRYPDAAEVNIPVAAYDKTKMRNYTAFVNMTSTDSIPFWNLHENCKSTKSGSQRLTLNAITNTTAFFPLNTWILWQMEFNATQCGAYLFNITTGDIIMQIKPITVTDTGVNNRRMRGGSNTLMDNFSVIEGSFSAQAPPPADTQNPTFATASINISNPRINDVVGLSQEVLDETLLASYRFADNRTGSFVNSSAFTIGGTTANATFNLTVTQVRGTVIGFQWSIADDAGNTNQTAIDSFTVSNTAPQTPTIIFPTPSLTTAQQPLDLNVTFPSDVDGDAITITYSINGVFNQTSETNTTLNASDGVFTLAVSLSDSFDSSSNATVTFTIDTLNPINNIILPVNNSIHEIQIPVQITCNNINVINLSYIFINESGSIFQTEHNDSDINDLGTQATLNVPITIAGLTDGVFSLNTTCLDNASNSDFEFHTLNIDTSIPAIVSTQLSNSSPEENDIIQLEITCSDTFIGIDTIFIANNASDITFTNITSSNFLNDSSATFQFNHTAVVGNITHVFTCIDGSGKSIQSANINYGGSETPSIIAAIIAGEIPLSNAANIAAMFVLFIILFGLFKLFIGKDKK